MSIEYRINRFLSAYPQVKKSIKRVYQMGNYLVSPKIKSDGDINRVTPLDGYEYFFGYYDKSPWDISGRYMLAHRAISTTKSVAPSESAEIVLIDTHNNNEITVLGKTSAWNVQQGSMLQWLGPDFSTRIIYNDYRNDDHCSIILNLDTRTERVIPMPVYSVSTDGLFALSLDFSRLHRLRKGYGYSNKRDITESDSCPDSACIWNINLITGFCTPIFHYNDFYDFEHRVEMEGAEHKVNHIMLSPHNDRAMVLHRWIKDGKRYTRLLTFSIQDNVLYNLNDDNMTSHCFWKNNQEIITYAHKYKMGEGYYLLYDKSNRFERLFPSLTNDGHPSYSPDRTKLITDTYPDKRRIARLYLVEDNNVTELAKVFAPFKYDNDLRCDLHPRWNRSGTKICFDSVFEGKRNLYTIKIKE